MEGEGGEGPDEGESAQPEIAGGEAFPDGREDEEQRGGQAGADAVFGSCRARILRRRFETCGGGWLAG